MGLTASEELIAALGGVVLERIEGDRFSVMGALPSWCRELRRSWGEVEWASPFPLADVFPVLGAFLPEAEDAWRGYGRGRVDSGFWTERGGDRREIHLEASALRADDKCVFVVMRNERLYLKEHTLVQRARELRLMHDSLTRELQSREILVHAIVHDLGAPLHSILGVLSLISETDLSDPARAWLEIAERAAVRQRELIDEILDVFLAAGDPSETARPDTGVDLGDVLERVLAERAPIAQLRHVRLEGPPAIRAVRVGGDAPRLVRILTNLLDNALRHSPSGGRILLSVRHEPAAVLLSVEDDGPGVAPELLPRLFERFARGADEGGRTGLGLFYCRITVEKWGGGIGYERREEGGARFWLRLPRRAGDREASHGKIPPAR